MWSDNKKKIRRFLRDPDAKLWDDVFLLRLWNDEQKEFGRAHHFNEAVTILRHPALYQSTFCYPWEYAYNQHAEGYSRKAFKYHQQWEGAVCWLWEVQEVGINITSDIDSGYMVTQPWESYIVINPAEYLPMWFPDDMKSVVFMAYDKDPLEYIPYKQLMYQDRSFKTYSGEPENYTIIDEYSKEFYLYPTPGVVWDDIEGEGLMMDTSWAESSAEIGTPIDLTETVFTSDIGGALDALQIEDNVLLIYKRSFNDIQYDTDIPNLSRYLQKYIEQGVLSKAYQANTDGKIKSLADYWTWRKQLGSEVMKRLAWKRLEDRNFQLTFGSVPRARRGPRLPSTYPPV